MTEGRFITFEGTEGSGKSTQMRILVERLRKEGLAVTENQEPGATGIGKQIRRILLSPENGAMAAMTELLLMFASRAQAAAEIIVPALERGDAVVSDRFTDSTLAYQGAARGLGFDLVRRAHELAVGKLWPDLTVCIEVDVEEGLQRAYRRNLLASGEPESRIDQQNPAFHRRVLEAYRAIAEEESKRFLLIDGRGSADAVAERVWAAVSERIELPA